MIEDSHDPKRPLQETYQLSKFTMTVSADLLVIRTPDSYPSKLALVRLPDVYIWLGLQCNV